MSRNLEIVRSKQNDSVDKLKQRQYGYRPSDLQNNNSVLLGKSPATYDPNPELLEHNNQVSAVSLDESNLRLRERLIRREQSYGLNLRLREPKPKISANYYKNQRDAEIHLNRGQNRGY